MMVVETERLEFSMRTAALALVSLLLAAPAVLLSAPVPKEKTKPNAEKVLGKCKLVKTTSGDKEVPILIVEFTKDGKMTVTQGDGGVKYEGTYKVEGETIPYKLKIGASEKVETLKIKKLTDDELHVVDPDEIQEDFKRVVEKK